MRPTTVPVCTASSAGRRLNATHARARAHTHTHTHTHCLNARTRRRRHVVRPGPGHGCALPRRCVVAAAPLAAEHGRRDAHAAAAGNQALHVVRPGPRPLRRTHGRMTARAVPVQQIKTPTPAGGGRRGARRGRDGGSGLPRTAMCGRDGGGVWRGRGGRHAAAPVTAARAARQGARRLPAESARLHTQCRDVSPAAPMVPCRGQGDVKSAAA